MRTLAAIAVEPRAPLVLEEVVLDDPRPHEVLVELVASGICHTDVGARDGRLPSPLPMILGHEGAGRVIEVGSAVRSLGVGDEVLLVADRCGSCPSCRSGRPTYCENVMDVVFAGVRADGTPRARRGDGSPVRAAFFGQSSFARHALATERNALKLPAGTDLSQVAALACGVPTGAGSVLYGLPVEAGSSFAVLGAGAVGLAALMAAVAAGATRVVAVDRVASRLSLARELGATAVLDTTAGDDLVGALRDHTGGGPVAVLDTTGDGELVRAALESLRTFGVLGFVTTRAPELSAPVASMLVGGKTLRGLMGGHAAPEVLVWRLLELHAAGRFPYERLVVPYPFEKINDAIEDALAGRSVKPVLRFEPPAA